MSEFDVYEAAFAGDLVARIGDAAGVEHEVRGSKAARKKYDAIIEPLRTESVETIRGSNLISELQDVVRVSVRCQPGVIGVADPLMIFKHSSGKAENYRAEQFVVQRIEASDPEWTILEAARKSLAAIKQQGS